MNPAVEGTVYPDVRFTVDASRLRAFREIFGQTEGVPPTFTTAAEFAVLPTILGDPRLQLDFGRVVHGSQSYDYRRPLREGETLTVRAKIVSAKVRSGTGFLTVAMGLFDDAGERVATARSQLIERASEP
jgi:acyl dehydratase